jgi:hypothetical protein
LRDPPRIPLCCPALVSSQALFVALIWVDVQRLPFYFTLIIKLVLFAAISAVSANLHFCPGRPLSDPTRRANHPPPLAIELWRV